MKLITSALALVLLLAVAAVALAAPSPGTYKGEVKSGYDISFKVTKGKITNVAANVLEYCDGESGSSITTIAPDGGWKIKKGGRFSGKKVEKFNGGSFTLTFEGRFTSGGKVKGKIRQESVVVGSLCDTYKLKFTAKKK